MSQYYELQHRVNTACSFRGNATINANAKPNLLASAAASSCIPSAAVFTPSAPPVLIPGAGAKTNTTSAGNAPGGSTTGGAMPSIISRGAFAGMTSAVACVVGGMIWTLA